MCVCVFDVVYVGVFVCVCVQQFSRSTRTKHVVDHIKQGRNQSKNHNAPQSTSRFLCAYCKFKGSTSGYDMQAVSSSNNNNKKEKLKQNIDINKRKRERERALLLLRLLNFF